MDWCLDTTAIKSEEQDSCLDRHNHLVSRAEITGPILQMLKLNFKRLSNLVEEKLLQSDRTGL